MPIRATVLSAFLMLGPASAASAQHIVGNGGKIVLCDESPEQPASATLLDFYEAEVMATDFVMDLGDSSLLPLEKVDMALRRLERLDSPRAALYRRFAETFFTEWLDRDFNLPDIQDTGDVRLTEGCTLHQVVEQIEPVFDGDRRYRVDRRLWNLLDANNQAGLILHEIIYRDALSRGHIDSANVRRFSSYVASNRAQLASADAYARFVRQTFMDAVFFREEGAVWVYRPLERAKYYEAEEICRSLQGQATLPSSRQWRDVARRLLASPVGHAIEAVYGRRGTLLWGDDGVRAFLADVSVDGYQEIARVDLTRVEGVICRLAR